VFSFEHDSGEGGEGIDLHDCERWYRNAAHRRRQCGRNARAIKTDGGSCTTLLAFIERKAHSWNKQRGIQLIGRSRCGGGQILSAPAVEWHGGAEECAMGRCIHTHPLGRSSTSTSTGHRLWTPLGIDNCRVVGI
jgi:hypothetical protein